MEAPLEEVKLVRDVGGFTFDCRSGGVLHARERDDKGWVAAGDGCQLLIQLQRDGGADVATPCPTGAGEVVGRPEGGDLGGGVWGGEDAGDV